jgi:hypothetical protein
VRVSDVSAPFVDVGERFPFDPAFCVCLRFVCVEEDRLGEFVVLCTCGGVVACAFLCTRVCLCVCVFLCVYLCGVYLRMCGYVCFCLLQFCKRMHMYVCVCYTAMYTTQ